MTHLPIALALAVAIGVSLALFGAGGSIVTMPVLVYVLGLDPHRAAGTSLVVVGIVACAGAVAQRRTASLRGALGFALAGMAGALPGAWLNHHTPAVVVMLGFAITMLAAGLRMARTFPLRPAREPAASPLHAMALGLLVGMATGFFGVGGGFLIVPALTLFLGLPMQRAVATSLVVIALNSAAGLAGHLTYGAVDWWLGGVLSAAALTGTALTLPLARHVSGPALQRGFAAALGMLGAVMLLETVRGLLA